ncbi:MAG: potassium transporter TrkH [Spartobacteria bacterium]|nr:potassium transporter TrkH [Spartobacteria bacterium]
MRKRAHIARIGIEGALMALAPLPLLFPCIESNPLSNPWQAGVALLAAVACFACGLSMLRKPDMGRIMGTIAVLGSYIAALPYVVANPFVALNATVVLVGALFALADFKMNVYLERKTEHRTRCLQRAWWAALMVLVLVVIDLHMKKPETLYTVHVLALSSLIAQVLFFLWAYEIKSRFGLVLVGCALLAVVGAYLFSMVTLLPGIILLISLFSVLVLSRHRKEESRKEPWWEVLLNHPSRILSTTFLALCLFGSFLLSFPAATKEGAIELVDAVFTSVSAVCVTGLIVLDTPNDFTLFGQLAILLLIQVGGLGIMSITTVALHAMGRRLSLKRERLFTSMTDTGPHDLVQSLSFILKYTAAMELVGAILLTTLFYTAGDDGAMALRRGVFTAVSAFCNAGFSLQSDSLIAYQGRPLILHVVAILIVLGGLAPATGMMIPRWIRRRPIPILPRIALVTTLALLLVGTLCILVFEWDGILAGLPFTRKLLNAWFQSVTLRTAGFNSVDLAPIASPTFMIMIVFMFIGGSPGGTAGGVKTTTIGILAMTFWAHITNRNEVIIRNKRIRPITINRAVSLVAAGLVIWTLMVMMLIITQQVSARALIFEATSAIGTVGLSIGATPLLDEIGKIIVIIAMFTGRIGPMTLFMLLNNEQSVTVSRCPDANVILT